MKKTLILTMATLLIASGVSAAVIVSDDFSYPDGSLVGNGTWASHSGTPGDFLVASGKAVCQHGVPSEDVNIPFTPTGGGTIYYGLDFSVDDLGHPFTGTDNEYFAHFRVGFNFSARLDIVEPTGGGDFSVGIGSDESTADAIWATDLSYGVTYRAIVSYDQDGNIAELWIDPTAPGDTSILGEDRPDPGDVPDSFALRQSDSSENETVRVDNLVVADDFDGACPDCGGVPTESRTWGHIKSLFK